MSIFTTASALVAAAKAPIDTANKNEVLYAQKLVNTLVLSPIVKKIIGKTIKLVEDGKFGPLTENALITTFGEIPSKVRMIAVESKYKEIAAKAVKAQQTPVSSAESNSWITQMINVLTPGASAGSATVTMVPEAVVVKAKAISNGSQKFNAADLLRQANENAQRIFEDRLREQEELNSLRVPDNSNTSKIILISAAALALILILK